MTLGVGSIGGHKQFSLVANCDLVAEQYLQELLGMVTVVIQDRVMITDSPAWMKKIQ